MSIDTALFLVDRGNVNYNSSGANISSRMVANDKVLVQRGTDHFYAVYNGTSWDQILDTDLLLAWDDNTNKHVTGANFKNLF